MEKTVGFGSSPLTHTLTLSPQTYAHEHTQTSIFLGAGGTVMCPSPTAAKTVVKKYYRGALIQTHLHKQSQCDVLSCSILDTDVCVDRRPGLRKKNAVVKLLRS